MNLAFSAAHGSKCLKRQVGAVLVSAPPNQMGEIVGQGFNENPFVTSPCVEEKRYGAKPARGIPGGCYRDIVRHQAFARLAALGRRCPECGGVIKAPIPPAATMALQDVRSGSRRILLA